MSTAVRAAHAAVLDVGRAAAEAGRRAIDTLAAGARWTGQALARGAGAITVRPARGLLAGVARASLGAQDLVDARVARRQARAKAGPADGAEAASRPTADEAEDGAEGEAEEDGAAADATESPVAPRLRPVVRDVARRGAQVAGVVAVAALLMGVGRTNVTATLSVDSTSSVPTTTPPDGEEHSERPDPTELDPAPIDPQPTNGQEPNVDLTAEAEPSAEDAPSVPTSELDRDGRPARPLEVRLPALRVTAPLIDVGVEPDGAMEIPEDVRTVGWYEPAPGAGVVPGEDGTAVLAGHVDSRAQGPGAFWALRDLVPADRVEVVHEDGSVSLWEVTEVIRYPKAEVPIEDIFVWSGPKRLALITCGGEFDRSIGSYLDNYVVLARPVGVGLLDGSVDSGLAGALPEGPDGT